MAEVKWIDTPASSNVNRVGYDKENQGMYVEFSTKKVYVYLQVPEDKFNQALNAVSIGKFIATEIKGKYTCKML